MDFPAVDRFNGQDLERWAEGTVLEGRVLDLNVGKYGLLMLFNDTTKANTFAYSVPARLKDSVSIGAVLRIRCLGKKPSGIYKAWDFLVDKLEKSGPPRYDLEPETPQGLPTVDLFGADDAQP